MDLYLIRHAHALALHQENITRDEERLLSDKGRAQCKLLAESLQRRGVQLDRFVTSPLVRACQTAEGIRQHWTNPSAEIVACEHLAPGGSMRKIAKFLRGQSDKRVALVGHAPDLNDTAAWLIGSRKAQIDFAKAGVAHLVCGDTLDKGCGTLVWLVTPEWL